MPELLRTVDKKDCEFCRDPKFRVEDDTMLPILVCVEHYEEAKDHLLSEGCTIIEADLN